MSNQVAIEELCEKVEEGPDWLYKFIIGFLTSIDMSEEEARKHYFNILEHKYYLSEKMDRDIGFRVATLDYFLNITKQFINPKVVEIALFEQLLEMTKVDSKTGCFNFRFFKDMLEAELKRAERYEYSFSIILLDLDNFKEVNDKYGHLFADKVLEKIANIIRENLRKEDIVARYGGDEFIIMLPHTGRVGARCMGEKLRHRINEYFKDKTYQGKPFGVSFSAGIATYPFDARDAFSLIDDADKALYRSKGFGKNCIYDYLEEACVKNNLSESDRRQYRRYLIKSHIGVDIYDESELLQVNGKIVNISAGGALLECTCRVREDVVARDLKLRLRELFDNRNGHSSLQGNIVRVTKEHQNLKFYIGMKFSEQLGPECWHIIEEKASLDPI